MSSPSLVLVPARYKATKLYTQYPTDGSADFIVSQASGNSTRVNASGFVEAVSANIPRIDYRNVAQSIDCPALLVEPSAQNVCFQSQGFSTSPWIAGGVTVTGTTQTNSPDGTQNAFDITIANTGFSTLRQFIACANNTTYTVSCFYKNKALVAGETFEMRYTNENLAPNNLNAIATIDLAAGTATYLLAGTSGTGFSGTATGRVENYGNGWYRVSMTFTVGSAGANVNGIFRPIAGVSISRNFYAWGAQLETGSVATSYIPTTTAALTRGADIIYVSGAVSGTIGQASGTIYAEVDMRNWSASGRVVAISNGTQDGCMVIHANADRSFTVFTNASSFNQLTMQTVSGLYNGVHRVAFAYKKDDFAFYLNGALVSSHTSGTVPATNHLYVGKIETSGSTNFLNDRVRSVALFKTRLSNSDLSILTGIDYTDLTWNTYTTRTSLSTELPTCLLTRYFELINV